MSKSIKQWVGAFGANVHKLRKENAELKAELAEWKRLENPAVLQVSLLQGKPARLTSDQLRHIAGDFAAPSEGQAIPTDLSKRLRAHAANIVHGCAPYRDMLAAADEIDHLGGVNRELVDKCNFYNRDGARLDAKIAELADELAKKGQP